MQQTNPAGGADAAALDVDQLRGRTIVIVGLGGIGGFLARLIVLFLRSLRDVPVRVCLVDGDHYEDRNRDRMEAPDLDNKAVVMAELLTEQLGRAKLSIRPVDQFVNDDNVQQLVSDGDIVFSCVDNHATRKLLGARAEALDNIVLISGGNDGVEGDKQGSYGNIQLYRREGGHDLHPPLTRFHPEIADPVDEVPSESCEDLVASTAPQIVFTNFFAAAVMGNAFYRLLRRDSPNAGEMYDEACFDILEARLVPQRFG